MLTVASWLAISASPAMSGITTPDAQSLNAAGDKKASRLPVL